MIRKLAALLFTLSLLAFGAVGCGDSAPDQDADAGAPTAKPTTTVIQSAPPGSDTALSVGETAAIGDLRLTVNSVHWVAEEEYWESAGISGGIMLDCTLENTGTQPQQLADGPPMFQLSDGSVNRGWLTTNETTANPLPEELAAGSTANGLLAFTVDEGQERWEFEFRPHVLEGDQTRTVHEITTADVQ